MNTSFSERLDKLLVILEARYPSKDDLQYLDTICIKLGIPGMIIGGMAVGAHGYPRQTADIDIVTTQPDAHKLAATLLASGWADAGSNKLKDKTNLLINLCATGVKAGTVAFPEPDHIDPGLTVIKLPALIGLKVRANRHKDRTDVIELIKANRLPKEYITGQVLPLLARKIDQRMVLALWEKAIKEQ